jgi:hypothetical protein
MLYVGGAARAAVSDPRACTHSHQSADADPGADPDPVADQPQADSEPDPDHADPGSRPRLGHR